jgi:hypothetical protein
MKHSTRVVLTLLFCTAAIIGYGQTPDANSAKSDNTKVNKRDRNPGEVTADQQN